VSATQGTGPTQGTPRAASVFEGHLKRPAPACRADSYALITRSQEIEVDAHGPMPPGSLQSIETALRRSPQFQVVVDTGDATVFVIRGR
jgi:hypothetical protein